ncbi:hypothetical protein SELMODRAFT_426614 [Selaginella moellendorffii]|uniref:Uncharacterized protein n=1 Tax=Selaginella moellendorffii TaxID=88036 RepID=D8SWY2_SELML|nr:hypothetical protein SELMODRAFT_426614 [Selaginella moellendorffii]
MTDQVWISRDDGTTWKECESKFLSERILAAKSSGTTKFAFFSGCLALTVVDLKKMTVSKTWGRKPSKIKISKSESSSTPESGSKPDSSSTPDSMAATSPDSMDASSPDSIDASSQRMVPVWHHSALQLVPVPGECSEGSKLTGKQWLDWLVDNKLAEFLEKVHGGSDMKLSPYVVTPGEREKHPIYSKFCEAFYNPERGTEMGSIGIGFHGTPEVNIDSILRNGFSKSCHADFYFARSAVFARDYCRRGHQLSRVVIVLDIQSKTKDGNICVVPCGTPHYLLPIATFWI